MKERVSEVSAVIYKGTKYSKGLAVFMNHNERGGMSGKIPMILISLKEVYFVVDTLQSLLLMDLGLH